MPARAVGDECTKRAVDDDRDLRVVDELARGQLDDSGRFDEPAPSRRWKYSEEALSERV